MDLLRWFTGEEVEWVEANQYQGQEQLDGYLLAHLRLTNGVGVQHMVSWCTPEISGISNQSSFEVYCTKGILQLSETAPLGAVFQENNRVDVLDSGYAPVVEDQLVGPFKNLVDYFVCCIRNGETPGITVDDALASVRICAAMERSAKESRRVFLEELS
jgi:predicted dehydrogenase